ncbi:hypothetical protein SELMODRAFT_228484, partial [Selaginella moellendorffii]
MVGGMEFKPNKHLEEWLYMRENQAEHFRFNKQTTKTAVIWGLIVPFLAYRFIVSEFHAQDVKAGRPRREFLGAKG